MNRYFSSFILTLGIYLITAFFLVYVFTDTLIIPEKKQEEIKTISLKHVAIKQEVQKPQTEPEPTPKVTEPEIIPEPIIQTAKAIKKVEKIKEVVKKEKKQVEKVVEENIVQIPIQDTKPIDKAIVEEVVTKQIDTTQIQSIEDAYLSKIRSEIEKNKTYPKVAKRLNHTGKVYITFLVTKDGVIKNCRINKSSNFESLDEASIETLMKIANFEAIPKELNKEFWEITVPIVYQIS